MTTPPFAGIYVFSRDRCRPSKLFRALALRAAAPAPGLALPARSPFLRFAGGGGSWLQLESSGLEGAAAAAALYQKHGASFPSAMRGRFAFSLYDAAQNRLLLGTDRFAEIPVFYALFSGGLAWAEDPSLLRLLPGVDSSLDPRAVDLYLAMRYVPSPFTMHKGVRKLPAASVLAVRGGELSINAYWTPSMKEGKFRSLNEAAEAVHAAMLKANRARLGAVKRAAALVSGGIDSSSAAALAAHRGVTLSTFTLGVPGGKGDFFSPGRKLAEAIGSRHAGIDYGTPDSGALLEMSAAYGQPQSDNCEFPLWKAAEKMKGCAGVLFSGDGGDENFAGYARIRWMIDMARQHRTTERESLLAKALAAGARLPPAILKKIRGAAGNRLKTVYHELAMLYFGSSGDFYREADRLELYRPEFLASLGKDHETAAERVFKIFRNTAGGELLNRLTLPDLTLLHPECTVPRLRATAARAGMRVVFPYNDHELVDLARSVPEKWRLPPKGECKLILRRAMRRHLPRGITSGKQTPFHVPAELWLKGPLSGLFRDSVLAADARTAPFFRRRTAERLLEEHVAGQKEHKGKLWSLLMLELWLRTH